MRAQQYRANHGVVCGRVDPNLVYKVLIAFDMQLLKVLYENVPLMLDFVPYRCAAILHRPMYTRPIIKMERESKWMRGLAVETYDVVSF